MQTNRMLITFWDRPYIYSRPFVDSDGTSHPEKGVFIWHRTVDASYWFEYPLRNLNQDSLADFADTIYSFCTIAPYQAKQGRKKNRYTWNPDFTI